MQKVSKVALDKAGPWRIVFFIINFLQYFSSKLDKMKTAPLPLQLGWPWLVR